MQLVFGVLFFSSTETCVKGLSKLKQPWFVLFFQSFQGVLVRGHSLLLFAERRTECDNIGVTLLLCFQHVHGSGSHSAGAWTGLGVHGTPERLWHHEPVRRRQQPSAFPDHRDGDSGGARLQRDGLPLPVHPDPGQRRHPVPDPRDGRRRRCHGVPPRDPRRDVQRGGTDSPQPGGQNQTHWTRVSDRCCVSREWNGQWDGDPIWEPQVQSVFPGWRWWVWFQWFEQHHDHEQQGRVPHARSGSDGGGTPAQEGDGTLRVLLYPDVQPSFQTFQLVAVKNHQQTLWGDWPTAKICWKGQSCSSWSKAQEIQSRPTWRCFRFRWKNYDVVLFCVGLLFLLLSTCGFQWGFQGKRSNHLPGNIAERVRQSAEASWECAHAQWRRNSCCWTHSVQTQIRRTVAITGYFSVSSMRELNKK